MIVKLSLVLFSVLVSYIVTTNSVSTTPNPNCPYNYVCCSTCDKQCCGSDIFSQDCRDDCNGVACSTDGDCGNGCCTSDDGRKICQDCSEWNFMILVGVIAGLVFIVMLTICVCVAGKRYLREEKKLIATNIHLRHPSSAFHNPESGSPIDVSHTGLNNRPSHPFTVKSHPFNGRFSDEGSRRQPYDNPDWESPIDASPGPSNRPDQRFTAESHPLNEEPRDPDGSTRPYGVCPVVPFTHESNQPPSYHTFEGNSNGLISPPSYVTSPRRL